MSPGWANIFGAYKEQLFYEENIKKYPKLLQQKFLKLRWVDDIILAASTLAEATLVKAMLGERFQMKDFG